MSEGKGRFQPTRVEPAVADLQTLGIDRPLRHAGVARGITRRRQVSLRFGKSHRQTAAGVGVTKQHRVDCTTGINTRNPGLHQRGQRVAPGREHGCTGLQHHNTAGIGRGDGGNQGILVARFVDTVQPDTEPIRTLH